jgi:uncharacterized membrane protein YfcA
MIFEALVSFGVIIGFLGLSILNMIDGDWAKAILQLFVSFLWIRILLKGLRRSELKILIVSNEKKAFQIFIGKEESVARKLVTRTKIKGETFIVCGRDFAGKIFKAGPIKNDDLPYFLDFFLDNKKCLLCHSLLLCNFLDRIPYI